MRINRSIFTSIVLGFALAVPAYAADGVEADPLSAAYKTPQQKKYFAEHMQKFMSMDKNSDGVLSPEEWLNDGNPLNPGFEQDAKYKDRYFAWKQMDKTGRGTVTMKEFMAYMDTENPLDPSYKKR